MSFRLWAQAAKTFAEGTGRQLERQWATLQRQEDKLEQRQFEAERYSERLEAGYKRDIDVRDERRRWNKLQKGIAKDEAKVLKTQRDIEKSTTTGQGELNRLFGGLGVDPTYDRGVQVLSNKLKRAEKAGVLFDIYGEKGWGDPNISDVIELRGMAGRAEAAAKPNVDIIYRGTKYPVGTFVRRIDKTEDELHEIFRARRQDFWEVTGKPVDKWEEEVMQQTKDGGKGKEFVMRSDYIKARWGFSGYSELIRFEKKLEAQLKGMNQALYKTAKTEDNNMLKGWHDARPE